MEMYGLFYRLGILTKEFENCPTRLQLINELYPQLCKLDCLPMTLILSLKNHYSHRLLKQVMLEIGYNVQPTPNCSNFASYKIKKK